MVCTGSERVGPGHHRGTAVEHYAGIDVSLERSSVCVVDAIGRIIREAKVASEPEALVDFFRRLGLPLTRVGLEAVNPALHHPTLLRCSGSLANPPLLRGRSRR